MTLTQELQFYCGKILTGDIIACKRHKQACARFLRDLANQDTDAFPYVFNEKRAERFFAWCRLFKHRKGVLAGQPIEASPIHRFIFGNVYGWEHRETKYRRFNKMYWQVARKNAKSQFLSLAGLYETIVYPTDYGEATEVYCAATKTDQAKVVYDEAAAMLNACKDPAIVRKYVEAYHRITHKKSGSFMRTLSKDDKKSGDGYSPQFASIDEYHAHPDTEIYDVMDSGMGSRPQPLLAIITTAGFDLNNPCYRIEYSLVCKILDPDTPVELDNYFVMINELDYNDTGEDVFVEREGKQVKVPPGEVIDDTKDTEMWKKANPVICSYPEGIAYLEKKLAEALEAPEKMRNFLTKHVNVWVHMREAGYMLPARWAACACGLDGMPDLAGKTCCIGIDMSAKIDLTSVGFEFREDDMYYVFSHSFMPEETFEQRRKRDKIPYDLWVRQGWLTLTPGPVVDYKKPYEYAIKRSDDEGWRRNEWCVDMWGMTQAASDLEEMGETVVEIVQGIKTLSEPTKDFRNMVLARRVMHDGSPVMAWAMGNAIVDEVDRNSNIILNKKKSRERIDPVAAILNAHVRARIMEPVGEGRILFF